MFNPHPRLSSLLLQRPGGGEPLGEVVIADDFLLDPEALIDMAARHAPAFAPMAHNAFPGPELELPPSAMAGWVDALMTFAAARLGVQATPQAVSKAFGRLSLVTLQPSDLAPIQRLCHRDRLGTRSHERPLASVVYLFADPALGGTAFYAPRRSAADTDALMQGAATNDHAWLDQHLPGPRGYLVSSNAWFEAVAVVPPLFNRAIFYRGDMFHSSHIVQPQRLLSDPTRGRLTMNGFFVCSVER